MKNIAGLVGTIALRMVKVGATQTAVTKIQESSRKDIKEMSDLERIKELKERKLGFKVISNDKEEQAELIEKKSFATKAKDTSKVIGFGTANLLKIGIKEQTVYSLKELNKDEMKQMHGEATRVVKYQISPKLKNIRKIEA